MFPETTEVVIVGAGPSGLALGATLARHGIDFLLVDRLAQGQNTSRAAAIHARTLEVLESIGVSDELVRAGLQTRIFTVRDRDQQLLHVGFADLHTRYPYVLMLPQDRTEAILAEKLEQLGGTIRRLCEATGIRINAGNTGGAEVDIAVAGAPAKTVKARYVVAADGMHSVVREQAGIGFEPGTYAESFVLADVQMAWPFGTEEVQLFLSDAGLMVIAPFSASHYRIIATLADAPEHLSREALQALVDERGPSGDSTGTLARIEAVSWSSRFRIHHGIAARYRAGPVFLVGDAAHVHSPAGGQGMNIGIQDACDLGGRLASVLRDGADAAVLDQYEQVRRPVAAKVVSLTDRLTRVATLKGAGRQGLRNLAVEVLGHVPGMERRLAAQFAELR